MALTDLFDRSLVGRRDAPALECDRPDGTRAAFTFGELDARSNRVAQVLTRRGIGRGDRLAFYLANRVEIIDLWLACAKLGVIVVPINVLYREREIGHILGDAEPSAVVTTAAGSAAFPASPQRWDVDALSAEAEAQPAERPSPVHGDDIPAALVYTSGTTGVSKGAVLTHGNFAVNARALTECWRITAADRYLAALPLFHVHGLGNGIHCWLASGCHMRLVERFEHARAADLFDEYRPTLFFGVPAMYVRMLDIPPLRARAIGERMRLFVSGSAPLPAPVLDAFRTRFGQVILERYGMTETLMNTSNPYEGERRAGTVGFPLPHVDLRIADASGAAVPDGAPGELLVRGPHVCSSYWRRNDATRAAWRDGWFHTGDVGTRSSDGYITLQGRRSDLIISGGFNIYPREIEDVLLEQPGICEAVVVGAADPVRGEVPVAYVVADDAFDESALRERLRSQLASFKLPKTYVRLAVLPRTALGKVQKHLLPRPGAE
ncbi:MAG TPA: AMP-binding protein [Gemmatimonadaceae bacterium]|nr:AMP-binding protein [Gemmatimonadaceae bacterium]